MSIASRGVRWGAHRPIEPGGDLLEAINLWEQAVGRRMDLVLHYRKFGAPSGSFDTARTSLQQACGAGRSPLITWEPVNSDGTTGPYSLPSIAAGIHDQYLNSWADGLRLLEAPVYLRPFHEMNGNWYPWAGDPEAFVAAWRHIVELFAARGARNVSFVWCVNASDQPKENKLENYWPGEHWVDVMGVDGYNNYGGWRPFEKIIRPAYDRLCRLSDTLPIWVCETATAEGSPTLWEGTGHWSKPDWFKALGATESMERLGAICYFDAKNPQSYDWRLSTTGASASAFRNLLYQSNGYVQPPGPYVPPVPTRVGVDYLGPGTIGVTWRTVPSFHRGCQVRATSSDGHMFTHNVLKPATSARLTGLVQGQYLITVASHTLVRTSRPSLPALAYVAETF